MAGARYIQLRYPNQFDSSTKFASVNTIEKKVNTIEFGCRTRYLAAIMK